MPTDTKDNYLFDHPGYYTIRVEGELDPWWLDHLEGLKISTGVWGNYELVSEINGWLADQSALAGLLDLLTDMGRVILTVERIEDELGTH